MPFDPVDPKQSFPALERGILSYWKEEDIFKRSLAQRKDGESFSFYDGPPFATGLPHYGHLLAGTIKDVIPRYQAMRGKYVERRFGWDCHGLPVENLIEKEHNIADRKAIEAMGVEAFNGLCRSSVLRYVDEWRKVVERMGRWVDMDHDYRTMDPEYMESIWWVFGELYKKGLIYEGHKPMHVCPRCVTPLSNFEVTQGYKDITDQSVTVKFEVTSAFAKASADKGKTFILAWTTTPWTLPGNLLLAVHPKTKYVCVGFEGNTYIVAEDLLDTPQTFAGKEHEILGKPFAGKELIGTSYRPLFPYFVSDYPTAFRVVGADFVTTEDGTGIVHIAPGFGEDDYAIGKKEELAVLQHITMDGHFVPAVTDFAGMEAKPKDDPTKTDQKIIAHLKKDELVFAQQSYKHSYPHCWRCDSPLLNYATSSWFVTVEKIKKDMLAANGETEWVPGHIRDGRFGKWLENARDWAISRNRYWGTPLPIWRCTDTGDVEVICGQQDLMNHHRIRFTRITAVRHGESEGNLIPIYQGKAPATDLTESGLAQAKAAGEALKNEGVTVVYCSPLARTRQTAQGIADAAGVEVIVDERLREVNFGEYEGKTVDFSDLEFVKARRAHKIESNQPESIFHLPGMEPWRSVQDRIDDFLRDVLPRHRSDHIVVVTHADPIQVITHYFTKEDPVKISHQPYPQYADPRTFFWDHDRQAAVDLHKEVVDGIAWPGSKSERSVDAVFVRHGETEWNKERRIQGSSAEVPLNDTGRAQVQELATRMKGEQFDAIVCSDLTRAKETAQILSDALGLPIEAEWSELRERGFGAWEGKLQSEVISETGAQLLPGKVAFQPLYGEGGESLSQFLARIDKARRRLLSEFPGRRVLVVSHGGAIQAMRTLSENLSWNEAILAAPKNAEMMEIPLHPLLERIPEVLDCWFESGSMPYAQAHYLGVGSRGLGVGNEASKKRKGLPPTPDSLPPNFPADFIAEGIDQTRGWFYTLTVLSSALFKSPAFRHCVVNGIVLAEDGKKMSKRLKNYPEPMEVVEKMGADAVRFTLMNSPAVRGEDLRFSEKLTEETLRTVLLPLWNTYSFFVTYANAANFSPSTDRRTSKQPLDRYILAEVQDLVNRMTEQLDAYELSATTSELHDTIDALTNWYVRMSRRRFAGKGSISTVEASGMIDSPASEDDQRDALSTLYDVLLTVSQLLAPFCPYITDAIYLNLSASKHGSIHLTDWPASRALTTDELSLLERTRVLRRVVTLGLSVRAEKKIKVRQPLASATVALPPSVTLSQEDRMLLMQELNVKNVEWAKDPAMLADVLLQVDARKVGPRLGGRVQEVIKAGKAGEFTIQEDGSILVLDIILSPDEAAVSYRGKEGHDVAADHGIVVSIDAVISPELEQEGRMRDLVRFIQQKRKESGLAFTDRILLSIENADEILASFGDAIAEETKATLGSAQGETHELELDGAIVRVHFSKI